MSYNREVFNRVKEEYENKYLRNREAAEERRAELHSKSVEITEIDNELSKVGLKLFKEAINGREGLDERLAIIKKDNDALLEKRKKLVVALGYPANYSDIQYECNKCEDTGICNGKWCECFKKTLNLESYKTSGIGKLMKTQSFDTFDLSFYKGQDRTNMETVLEICREYAETFNAEEGKNLVLRGNTGLGKTHITTSIAKEIIDRGYDVVYDMAQNIFSLFEEKQFRNAKEDLVSKFYDCDLLVIDDLGSEMMTSFTVSCLYNIINVRINNNKSTIISTNLSWDEIRKAYTDRICSRLLGSFIPLEFKGVDIRMQKLSK